MRSFFLSYLLPFSASVVRIPFLFTPIHAEAIVSVWLLRDNNVEDYTAFLDKFLSLPHSSRTKVGSELSLLYIVLNIFDRLKKMRSWQNLLCMLRIVVFGPTCS